ncbi:MAG TPA: porin family protein [Gammaproteobacteria bacterium]|nr:porin family protein [Gammaproteobacteria bacterium]
MKHLHVIRWAALGGLLLTPLAALAVGGPMSGWTGAYVGAQAGLNNVSSDQTSSENAVTLGLLGGYDAQVSDHFVLGGDVFYNWNRKKDHSIDNCIGPCTTNYGTNVYGVDLRLGFPIGTSGGIMPYVKGGYGRANGTGDLSGDSNAWRYGAGIEFRPGDFLGLTLQYMHQNFGSDSDDLTNDNYTVGVNFHF